MLNDLALPILIVDDSVQYAQVLTRMLKNGLGYTNVSFLNNTQEAFELIRKEPERFGMLFVDYNFPDGNTGCEFLQKLDEHKLLGEKIAFLITSEPTPDNMKHAVAHGAKGVIAKPFELQKLKHQLDKVKHALSEDESDGF